MFMIGCVVGNFYEMTLNFLRTGELVQRKGVIYGPFNPVYGFALVVITLCLGKVKKGWQLFIFGSLIGGTFEYFCSFFQEKVFGTISWDYSNLFLNIDGRTTIPIAMFWGVLCLLIMKFVVPNISKLIEKIPKNIGSACTLVLVVFMVFNLGISTLAANRNLERHMSITPKNKLDIFLDKHYPDERIQEVYQDTSYVKNN